MTAHVFPAVAVVANVVRCLLWFSASLAFVCSAGDRVFRCVGQDGRIEFTQTGCVSGQSEAITIVVPEGGWVKPKRVPRKPFTHRSYSSADKPPANPEKRGNDKQCWGVQKRLQRVQRQLKRGYQPAKGDKLRLRRDELEDYVRRFCG